MGVSGSGKSTIGQRLARSLGWTFIDGDDHHPAANVAKMQSGVPLSDADRDPWLDTLHALVAEKIEAGQSVVLACSALRESYRKRLRGQIRNLRFVYLRGEAELIRARLEARPRHYMKPEMLDSQFETLEEPRDALTVSVEKSADEIVRYLEELANIE